MHFEHFSLTSLSRIQIIHFRKDKRLSLKFSTKSQTVKCRKNFGSKNIAQSYSAQKFWSSMDSILDTDSKLPTRTEASETQLIRRL